LDHRNDSEGNCGADFQLDIEQDNRIETQDSPEQRDVRAATNIPGLIQPTPKSKRQAATVLMMVKAIETRRNKRVKNSRTE